MAFRYDMQGKTAQQKVIVSKKDEENKRIKEEHIKEDLKIEKNMNNIVIRNNIDETEIHIRHSDPMFVQLYELITTYEQYQRGVNNKSIEDVVDTIEDFRNVLLK